MHKIFLTLFFALISGYAFSQRAQQADELISVDTSFLVKINGVEQYIEIKGKSNKNPVLLFIHGGPFWPSTPFIRSYLQALTNDFTVVSWDQRNCGKSQNDTSVMLTLDLFVDDAHLVTQQLKRTLHKEKISLVCHSWGSLIGIKLINKYPNDYSAYIGLGQMVNMIKSQSIALKYYEEQAKKANDSMTLNAIKMIPFSEKIGFKNGIEDLFKFNAAIEKYVFYEEDTSDTSPLIEYEDYTEESMMKNSLLNASTMTRDRVYKMVSIDMSSYNNFKIPIYFFVGKHDYITSFQLTEQYFNSIKAPQKKIFWFEKSGHSPNCEEPSLFMERIKEVLRNIK